LLRQMSACSELEFLSVESDLFDNIRVYFSDMLTHFNYDLELQKAESVCKAIAAINLFE